MGVVRYFLILFYGSYLSLRSSVVTLVSSRFGDVCLFLLICLGGRLINRKILLFGCLFLIIFTKSASFPFMRWLLEAMRAPTPVRSLVHSSTLVAAGVWFAMRYKVLLYGCSAGVVFRVFLVLTIIVTGLSCLFFLDLKKIVALSTCKNIAWCVFYMIYGDVVVSLFQLISHGVRKCILFILVGDVMSGTGGSQGRNCVYSAQLYGRWGIFGLLSVILGLSGAPFIGVFFTKHFLLGGFMGVHKMLFNGVLFGCVLLSYLYSFRFCGILIKLKASVVRGVLFVFDSGLIVYFWLFINYFLAFTLDERVSLKVVGSVTLLGFQLFSVFVAWAGYKSPLFAY